MLPLGTLSLGLWAIAVDPAFIAAHQSIKNYEIWIDHLDHLPVVMTTSFFLIFSEHPWDKLPANLLHLQFLANNFEYSSYTDIKLCTYCLYRHTTVLIHEILYLANQLWCIDFLTPPTPLIIPHRLPVFLESFMPLRNWCSIHARCSKSSLKLSIRFWGIFFPSLKQNFVAYRSSKVSSRPDCIFEIHQLWQTAFCRVYSNCCCSCSFEPEIIKIWPSSHKMYSNNILNFQESTTILNTCTKKSGNLLKAPRIYIYIYIFCLELPKLCYHPWLAADEDRVSHALSHVVWWKKKYVNFVFVQYDVRPVWRDLVKTWTFVLYGMFWKWPQILVVIGFFCCIWVLLRWLWKNWMCIWALTCRRKGRFDRHLFWLIVCVR